MVANGLEIACDIRGAGPPLVILHGASSIGRDDFGPQLPIWAAAFRCYLPDARGHGGTRWDPGEGLRYDDLVADVAALADALGLRTFHLVGFSMGAATALAFAAAHPERLRTLVIVGMSNLREPRTSVIRRVADVARIEAHDPAWAARLADRHDPVQGAGGWRRLMPAIIRLVEGQGPHPAAELHRIDMPVLVVAGDRDPYVPAGQAWDLARLLPDGRLFVLPDCGHVAMVQRPGLFAEGCASFWRSTAAVAAKRA